MVRSYGAPASSRLTYRPGYIARAGWKPALHIGFIFGFILASVISFTLCYIIICRNPNVGFAHNPNFKAASNLKLVI